MKEHWTSVIFIAVMLMAFLLGPSLGAVIYAHLSPRNAPSGDILVENQSLKAQLAELVSLRKDIPSQVGNYKTALVYSRYPFNFKNEIVINAGIKDGLNKGNIVVVSSQSASTSAAVYLGSIRDVYDNSSAIQTIFDPNFQAAVKIGTEGIDALLKGGAEPRLTMISKDASIAPGDPVYSVSPNLPYGISMGQVDKMSSSNGQFFIETSIKLPYDINLLKYVSVIPSAK